MAKCSHGGCNLFCEEGLEDIEIKLRHRGRFRYGFIARIQLMLVAPL